MTSTEDKNTSEDAEMADCDGEKVVTMMDVLQEQEDFEDDVNAVLGASDEKNCTYPKGYIKRQAIYACMTCCSEAKDDPTKRAGVCLACSLTCHENHDLIELYTKRNFKCDCGNPKFNSHPCQFTPDKTDLNEENNYNQNFSGVYCVCQRPYPDPESPTDVEMIQCIVCEDWLHATHLEATVPDSDQYSEMICKGCMEKNEFLHDYSNLAVNIDVDVVTNGIDNDKICNGDTKLEAVKDETEKSTDEANGIIETNNETIESPNEKKDDKSVDTPMETEEKEIPQEKVIEESTEKVDEEKTPDVDNQSESTNKEHKIEHEPPGDIKETENGAETEKIEKSAEQLEEEKLLADPDDDTKKSEEKSDIKEDEPVKNTDNMNTETPTDVNDTPKQTEPKNEDKQNDSNSSVHAAETESEKQVEEKIDENSTAEDKDEEMKAPNNTPNVTEETKPEGVLNGEHNKITEKRKLSTEENIDTDNKKPKLEETKEVCVRPKGVSRVHKGATFWPSTFRQKLCTCRECITMYKDLSVLFLIDPEDTVTAYENLGKQKINGKPASQYEKGLAALSSLDRIQQINALTEYNKMRDKLLDFLKSFKDRREVVKEEDIKAFFAGMKPKREPDGVYFCR